jgi:penicillin-binding protein 2
MSPSPDLSLKRRLWAFRGIVILVFLIFAFQMWRLQIVEGERYQMLADRNRFRLAPIEAARGVIYDRHGRILVRNLPSFSVTHPGTEPPQLLRHDNTSLFARG